jgi:ribose transport system ATP-binding protein
MDQNQPPILEAIEISKLYPGVQALDNVSVTIAKGEVRALVGENGAGKSTFVNVIGGITRPDSGSLCVDGREVKIRSPKQAAENGIAIVHQELSLYPNLDVASNLFLSRLDEQGKLLTPERHMRREAHAVLERVGLEHIPPTRKVGQLMPGEQQLVEIGRALVKDVKVLVLDEPTSSLAEREIRTLFRIINELKAQGISVIFVSHRMEEIFEICDSITVFRDGKHIRTVRTQEINNNDLVRLILGRKFDEMYQAAATFRHGSELLRVENLTQEPRLKGVSFTLKEGEILGIVGLLGSGRTELMRAVFGLDTFAQGEIYLKSQKVRITSPDQAIRLGIGFITEDRHREGLVLEKSIKDNIALASLRRVANRLGWVLPGREMAAARRQKEKLNIVTPSVLRKVKYLSGGNQQKVVLSKWLETHPQIFILDEPTRGIDVGAKADFYKIIQGLAEEGAGVIFISSELQEIVSVCHRVLVLRHGSFCSEFTGEQISGANILLAMTGGE